MGMVAIGELTCGDKGLHGPLRPNDYSSPAGRPSKYRIDGA